MNNFSENSGLEEVGKPEPGTDPHDNGGVMERAATRTEGIHGGSLNSHDLDQATSPMVNPLFQ